MNLKWKKASEKWYLQQAEVHKANYVQGNTSFGWSTVTNTNRIKINQISMYYEITAVGDVRETGLTWVAFFVAEHYSWSNSCELGRAKSLAGAIEIANKNFKKEFNERETTRLPNRKGQFRKHKS